MSRRLSSRKVRRSAQVANCAALEALEVRRLLANIVVTTTDDESAVNATTSLREAIDLAAGMSSDDVIKFDPTVFSSGSLHTITLASGNLAIAGSTGKLDIQGPGSDTLEVDGNNLSRIFLIASDTDVTISGMQINNGADNSVGAGILVSSGGKLSLSNAVVSDNHLVGPNGDNASGAEIGGEGGSVYGAGIYSDGTLSVFNTNFSNNHATGGNGGNAIAGGGTGGWAAGGAIYTTYDLTIEDCAFDGNGVSAGTAGEDTNGDTTASAGRATGGAVHFSKYASGSITTSSFTGNTATGGTGALSPATAGEGGSASGGAVYSAQFELTISNSTFTNNQATGGVGGMGDKGGGGGEANGGAIFFDATGTVVDTTFTSNTALGGNGGAGATAFDAGSGAGGAISSWEDLTVTNCDFQDNSANGGNGVETESGGGTGQGGAIYTATMGLIEHSSFSSNIASGGGSAKEFAGQSEGGAIMIDGDASITDSTISGNFAVVPASGDDLQGREAFGGGILALNGSLAVTGSTIDHNFVSGGDAGDAVTANGKTGGPAKGGGIYASSSIVITNSTIAFNNSTGGTGGNSGGAFNGGQGGLGEGGGLYLSTAVGNAIVSVTIDSNVAVGGEGGTGNANGISGGSHGGNIASSEQLNPKNTIISRGSAQTGPDLFGVFAPEHSLISNTSGATITGSDNLLNIDPQINPLGDNGGPTQTMLPDVGSPVIDKGENTFSGSLTNDQRGDGFTRIVNDIIDIGAVEAGAAKAELKGNGIVIDDNDSTPSSLDGTAFGTAKLGTPIDRTFTITNVGQASLNLGFIDLPFGFSTLSPFTSPVAPGESTNFTIRFNPAFEGSFGGDVTISTNEGGSLNHLVFNISGTANGATARVNFQPQSAEVPTGYLLDGGFSYAQRGNGYTYGWNQNATVGTRDREVLSDQKTDTLNHMQLYGARTWEMSVPNGTYQVHVVMGDASYFDSTYKLNVEGVLTVNGKPTSGNRFIEGTKTVTVTDGKLTLTNATGAVNNKIDYIEVTPVANTIKVNFQTAASPTPSGFLADSGSLYGSRGNGQTYGWNLSAAGFTRDRNAGNSADQQHDTLVHTQIYGNRTWEIAVPNGSYQVHLVAGDASYFDSVYKINVEGTLTVAGTPNSLNRWVEGTKTVLVSDGKLTITNALGAVNNKLDFIEITPV